MTSQELRQQRQRIEALFDKTKSMVDDLELQGHWGRYLCVLAAGFLENALREIYVGRAKHSSSPDVASYVATSLSRVQNPKSQRFVETARAFEPSWVPALEAYLAEDDGHRRHAIDSIMANRHLIAHGKTATISIARVREYLNASIEVVEFIDAHVLQGR